MSELNKLNARAFSRIFIISDMTTDNVATWAEEKGIPPEVKLELLNTSVVSSDKASRHTALAIGQLFKEQASILIIDTGSGLVASSFANLLSEYQGAEMHYTVAYPTGKNFRLTDHPDEEFYIVNEFTPTDIITSITKPYNWTEACKAFRAGIPMRRLEMPVGHFVGYQEGQVLEADKFWIEANREAAIRNGGTMKVYSYFTYCDGEGVDMSWKPSEEDLDATDWIPFGYQMNLYNVSLTPGGLLQLDYELNNTKPGSKDGILHELDDVLKTDEMRNVIIISEHICPPLANMLRDVKDSYINKDRRLSKSTRIDLDDVYKEAKCETLKVTQMSPSTLWKEGINSHVTESVVNLAIHIYKQTAGVVIMDLKSFADTTPEGDKTRQDMNERACEFANQLSKAFKDLPKQYKNLRFHIVDIDALACED